MTADEAVDALAAMTTSGERRLVIHALLESTQREHFLLGYQEGAADYAPFPVDGPKDNWLAEAQAKGRRRCGERYDTPVAPRCPATFTTAYDERLRCELVMGHDDGIIGHTAVIDNHRYSWSGSDR